MSMQTIMKGRSLYTSQSKNFTAIKHIRGMVDALQDFKPSYTGKVDEILKKIRGIK